MNNKILVSIIVGMSMILILSGLVSAADVAVKTSDIKEVLSYLNSTGGIPLKVTTVNTTNWSQLAISLVLSSFFLLFFFGQMVSDGIDNTMVKVFLKTMKKKTGRPAMFIKHTQQGIFGGSMIDQTTINKISRGLNTFKGKDFDLILHTPGGEVFSALYISRLLKNYPGKIRTLIPSYAMSGGTLLALSTDEIYMAQSACLGPVDPQLGTLFKSGSAKSWNKIVKFKGKKAEDSSISMAMTGSQYTRSIRDHLEETIDFGLSTPQKKKLANYLTSGDVEHAFPLTRDRLISLGVPVKLMKNTKVIDKMIKIIEKTAGEGVTYAK